MRSTAINADIARRRTQAAAQSWRERLAGLVARGELSRRLVFATALAAIGFAILAFGGVYGWAYGAAYLAVYACLAACAVQCARGRWRPRWRWTYLPLALFGALAAWRYEWGETAVRGDTLSAFVHLLPAACLFVVITQVLRPEADRDWIVPTLALFTLGLALLAILQLMTATNGIYWHFRYTYASPAGPYVNRNHFAGCMELLIPMASVQAYRVRRRLWALMGWAMAPAMGVAAVLLSASRGGVLALLVESCAAVVALIVLRARSGAAPTPEPEAAAATETTGLAPRGGAALALPTPRRRPARRGPSREWLAFAVAVTMLLGAAAMVGTERIQNRFARFTMNEQMYRHLTVDTLPQSKRDALNASSLAMWRTRPVWGWGLGTWASVYPAFASFDDSTVYEFAHNDLLQVLVETGAVGAGLLAVFWMIWLAGALRTMRAPGGELAAAALIAVIGLGLHSWVDFNLHIPANLLLFMMVAGFALGEPATGESAPQAGEVTAADDLA